MALVTNWRDIASDAIKYTVVVSTFLITQHFGPLQGLMGTIAGRLSVAAGTIVLSLIVLDLLFGRPTLRYVWQVNERPVLGGWPELQRNRSDLLPEIGVTITAEGSSLLFVIAKLVAKSGKASCHTVFTPSSQVLAQLNYGAPHHDFNEQQNVLITRFIDGFTSEGTFPATFRFNTPQMARLDRKIGCKVSWKCEGRLRNRFLALAFSKAVGINGFNVKGD